MGVGGSCASAFAPKAESRFAASAELRPASGSTPAAAAAADGWTAQAGKVAARGGIFVREVRREAFPAGGKEKSERRECPLNLASSLSLSPTPRRPVP